MNSKALYYFNPMKCRKWFFYLKLDDRIIYFRRSSRGDGNIIFKVSEFCKRGINSSAIFRYRILVIALLLKYTL